MDIFSQLSKLSNSKNVCIIGHINPDADALASMVVFKNFLTSHFKITQVDLFAQTEFLNQASNELLQNEKLNPKENSYDTSIILDTPNLNRMGIYKKLYEQSNLKITIDHHQTNELFGDINIVENCSSTCEIVYSILKYFSYTLSNTDKAKLYAGIITDTNNFTVGNFNSKTFQIVSEISDSINIFEIHNQFLATTSLTNIKLLSLAIKNMSNFENNQILISHITKHQTKRLNATFNDFQGIINNLQKINTVKLVCFIYPTTNNQFYVSLRAKEGYNVSNLAKLKNGGGHKGAAAFNSSLKIKKIKQDVLKEFIQILTTTHVKNSPLFDIN